MRCDCNTSERSAHYCNSKSTEAKGRKILRMAIIVRCGNAVGPRSCCTRNFFTTSLSSEPYCAVVGGKVLSVGPVPGFVWRL